MLEDRGYRIVDGAIADDVTIAARAAKRPPDHDAGMRQARTTMNAWRASHEWGAPVYRRTGLDVERLPSPDVGVDEELAAMVRPDRGRLEAIARATHRPYDQVVQRRRRLRHWARTCSECDPDGPPRPMPDNWR